MSIQDNQKSGFISVVGLTNVGKSTLMNALIGAKVSIVSHKVQTTRQRLRGISIHNNAQLIFIDTPGYFKPSKRLDRAMIKSALSAPEEGDITLVIVDPLPSQFAKHQELIEKLRTPNDQVILVINKIDLVAKPALLECITAFTKLRNFAQVFLVSALKTQGLEEIKNYLAETVPAGPWLYPEDQLTDLSMRLLAAEMTREKIYHYLNQELPYAIHIETEKWENFENNAIKISQIIHVSRESQKGIVLGKGGATIKRIGQAAREELAHLIGVDVHLKLYVRVTPNWAENPENYKIMGLDFNA